ncbi:MAG: hypothetical protein AAGB02_01425 [Pseudomonadota bacterium]
MSEVLLISCVDNAANFTKGKQIVYNVFRAGALAVSCITLTKVLYDNLDGFSGFGVFGWASIVILAIWAIAALIQKDIEKPTVMLSMRFVGAFGSFIAMLLVASYIFLDVNVLEILAFVNLN